jgi:hypothetical protein
LAAARAEVEAKLEELKNDVDPAAAQAEEIKQATPDSVKAVSDEWLKRYLMVHTLAGAPGIGSRSNSSPAVADKCQPPMLAFPCRDSVYGKPRQMRERTRTWKRKATRRTFKIGR